MKWKTYESLIGNEDITFIAKLKKKIAFRYLVKGGDVQFGRAVCMHIKE